MKIKLTDLEPSFLRYQKDKEGRVHFLTVDTLADAMGVEFLCPKCFETNGGKIGTHGVVCWSRSRGAPEGVQPGPGRWKIDGTSFEDLTLNADAPSKKRSVQLHGGCGWHGYITDGYASEA